MNSFRNANGSFDYRFKDRLGNPIPLGQEEFFLIGRQFEAPPQNPWGLVAKAANAAWLAEIASEEEKAQQRFNEERKHLERKMQMEALCRRQRREREAARQLEREEMPRVGHFITFGSLPALELRSNMDEVIRQKEEAQACAFEARLRADNAKPAAITICGVRCPPIRGSWKMYIRRKGESYRDWKKRVRGMVAARKEGSFLREQERIEEIDPIYQLTGTLKRLGVFDNNRFAVLSGVSSCNTSPFLPGYTCPKKPVYTPRLPVYGPKHRPYWNYQQERLEIKQRLAALQSSWKERQQERRKGMKRMTFPAENHQKRTLRSCLFDLANQQMKSEIQRIVEEHEKEDLKNRTDYFRLNEKKIYDQIINEFYDGDPTKVFKNFDMYKKKWDDQLTSEIEGQMDDNRPAQGEVGPAIISTSNVEQQMQADEEQASALPPTDPDISYRELAAAQNPIEVSTFCERWYLLKNVIWNSSSLSGTELSEFNIEIPRDILENDHFRHSPNYILFSRHMYWRGDVEILIHINSNPRQYGQLQFSFYYGDSQDSDYENRNDLYLNSQKLHALVSASSANDVIMKIPFEYIFPNMAINRAQGDGFKSLGRLRCFVVVPLTVISTTEKSCTLTLSVRFVNNSFQGMVGETVADGEMFNLASFIAVKSLLDNNRDRPTMTSPGMPIIPVNTSSWCYGTNQADYCNILRLNPSCTLPYAEGRVPSIDEMQINYVKNIFGMLNIVDWTAQQRYGDILFSLNAVPLDKPDVYHKVIATEKQCYAIPPIGMLTSLFAYWRGSLELRIDIVGATEITGSLLIAYVPRVQHDYQLSIQDAIDCAHTEYDIRENRQISFTIPYVASQMFWPRRSTVSPYYPVYDPPGSIFCFIKNALIVNSTIPDNCRLVLYLRAGPDFELAVPASPSLGLAFNNTVYIPETLTNKIIILEGYFPVFSGTWRFAYCELVDGVDLQGQWVAVWQAMSGAHPFPGANLRGKWYVPILRYNNVSDHVVQFKYKVKDYSKFRKNHVAKIETSMTYHKGAYYIYPEKGEAIKKEFDCNYLAVQEIGEKYIYGYPMPSKEFADTYAEFMGEIVESYKENFVNNRMAIAWILALTQLENADYLKGSDKQFGYSSYPLDSDWWSPANFYCSPYPVVASGQMNEREKLVAPPSEPQASARQGMASRIVFGEQFLDLKDYCRRYQLYSTGVREFDKIGTITSMRSIVLKMPLVPQGLILDLGTKTSINEYWNRTREGPIPFIASSYRFFTGGLRFRICLNVTSKFTSAADPSGKIYVQHRPNVLNTSRRIIIADSSDLNSDDIELPGYAAWHQFEVLNNVLSVEVPFYVPSIRTYLQPTSNSFLAQHFSSLGELAIGITVYNFDKFKLSWDIYYSLADDARFSVFVGFPSAFDITDLPSVNPNSLRDFVPSQKAIEDNKSEASASSFDKVEECNIKEYKNLRYDVKQKAYLYVFKSLYHISVMPEFKHKCSELTSQELADISKKSQIYFPKGQMWSMFKSATAVPEVIEQTQDVMQTAKKVVDKIDDVTSTIEKQDVENLKDGLTWFAHIRKNISDAVPSIGGLGTKIRDYVDLVINAITNLLHCLLNMNIKTIVLALCSFFIQLGMFSYKFISAISSKLTNVFNVLFKEAGEVVNATSEQQNVEALGSIFDAIEGQMAIESAKEVQTEKDNAICAFVSTLMASLASAWNISYQFANNQRKHISAILLDGLGKFCLTANHLFTFIKNNLVAVKRIMDWLFSSHPSLRSLGFLKQDHIDIHGWATHVCKLTDPRREHEVFMSARHSADVFLLAQQAALLQIKLLTLGLKDVQVSVLNILVKKINDLRDKLATSHRSPPIRFEPFVYEFTGPSGIGKSEILKSLPYDIFKKLNFKHNGPLIYHRTLGNQYWNNLHNQPVLTIDEKFPIATPEFLGAQLAEHYQIKSSCVFNPPAAAVEDKNINYNPIIVQTASNNPFPKLSEFLHPESVYRRRDELIKTNFIPKIYTVHGPKAKFVDLTLEERGPYEKFQYLQFQFAKKVWDDADPGWGKIQNYDDMKDELIKRFQKFYIAEEEKFRREIIRIKSILPEEGEDCKFTELLNYGWMDSFQDSSAHTDKQSLEINRKIKEIKDSTIYVVEKPGEKEFTLFSIKCEKYFAELRGESLDKIAEIEKKLVAAEAKEYPEGQMNTPDVQDMRDFDTVISEIEENMIRMQANPPKPKSEGEPSTADYLEEFDEEARELVWSKYPQTRPFDRPPRHKYQLEEEKRQELKEIIKNVREEEFQVQNPDDLVCLCHLKQKHLLGNDAINFHREKQVFYTELNEDQCLLFCPVDPVKFGSRGSYVSAVKHYYPEVVRDDIIPGKEALAYAISECDHNKCYFRSLNQRLKYYARYIKSRPLILTHLLNVDNDPSEVLPTEYLEKHYNNYAASLKELQEKHNKVVEVVSEELSESKCRRWLRKIYDALFPADWTSFLKKLSIASGIISMFLLVFRGYCWARDGVSLSGSVSSELSGVAAGIKGATYDSDVLRAAAEENKKITTELRSIFGEAHVSGDYKTAKYIGKTAKPAFNAIQQNAQGQMEVLREDDVKKALKRNTFWLSTPSNNGCQMMGRCLGIYGTKAIVVSHYWEAWQKVLKLTGDPTIMFITCIDGRVSVINLKLNNIQFTPFQHGSLGIINIRGINNFKDIRNFIAPASVHSKLNGLASIYKLAYNETTVEMEKTNLKISGVEQIKCNGNDMWSEFLVHEGYEYFEFSGKGYCGSVLCAQGINTPIIGIHVAGVLKQNLGFSEIIYREMFDSNPVPSARHITGEGQMSRYFVDGECMALGKVAPRYAHRESDKSRIIPSIWQKYGDGKIYSEPAVLSNKDPRIKDAPFSPLLEGVKFHGMPLHPFPVEDLLLAAEDLENMILAKCEPQRPVSMLTRDEAIGGIPDMPGYEHMEFSTSEGFPFTGMRPAGAVNKKWLFTFDDNNHYQSIHPLLERVLDDKWQQRMDWEIPSTVFTDCLKDSTIDKEKVLTPGKTRVFSMSPVDFTIQQRQCTLDFVVAYMTNRRNLEHMIGCNPNSIEWTHLARDLLSNGSAIATGDYSKFGDTIPTEFIHIVFSIIRKWYIKNGYIDDEHQQQLRIMPHEIGNSIHLCFDHLYQVFCGQPSGNSLTVIINSLANSLYLRLAWIEIMRKTPFNSLSDFHKHVKMFSYGDDLIVSLSDTVKDQFNAVNWHIFFKYYKLKFTNADKSDFIVPYTTLAEADFLKSKFKPHPTRTSPQIFLACLGEASIEDTPNWVWKESFNRSEDGTLTYEDMCIQVCGDSLRNAFGRGPEYYMQWRNKLKNFWQKRGKHLSFDTWSQLDSKVFDFDQDLQPYYKFRLKMNP